MKKIHFIMLLLCMVCLINGCAEPIDTITTDPITSDRTTDDENEVLANIVRPTVANGFFELLCENFSANIYLGSSGARFLEFWLISDSDLEGESLVLCTNIGSEVQIEIPKAASTPFDFPFYVFVAYQDFSWGDYAVNEDAFTAELEQYKRAYDLLKSSLPQLFAYRIQVSFKQLGIATDAISETIQVNSLTAAIGDQKKEYSITGLRFLPDACTTKYGGGLSSQNLGMGGISINPSIDGYIELPKLKFTAKKDIVLENISFAGNESIDIIDCIVSIESKQGKKYTFTWDGSSPIDVDADSQLSLEVKLNHADLSNAIIGGSVDYMIVNYSDGETAYETAIQLYFSIFPAPHDIYAVKVDNIDMLPYYIDYYNVIQQGQ